MKCNKYYGVFICVFWGRFVYGGDVYCRILKDEREFIEEELGSVEEVRMFRFRIVR